MGLAATPISGSSPDWNRLASHSIEGVSMFAAFRKKIRGNYRHIPCGRMGVNSKVGECLPFRLTRSHAPDSFRETCAVGQPTSGRKFHRCVPAGARSGLCRETVRPQEIQNRPGSGSAPGASPRRSRLIRFASGASSRASTTSPRACSCRTHPRLRGAAEAVFWRGPLELQNTWEKR
jgi:hypothetical protein